ncbi:isochorismatase [Halalkalibacillus sediminis]|uniref:Isochorismatase n=1 Tax=Halalkalibacillus sediminis TaxID=2018042 RepID=A0A2I0QT59_9BACI|nr:isochorismatase family cysteine hydrolase [Halalkalibacillus sediminis]PKR77300.1 isochorismatase [Halalkalibacillus sediminis]
MKKTALVIIDIINDMEFDGGERLLEQSRPIVKPIQKLKKQARELDLPVIYVNDNFGLWQEDKDELIEHCLKGRGSEIANQLRPEDDEFFIIKPKHSGFYGTQLDILLRQLEVQNLVLTGVAGDICILFTANDAYMRDYNLWVPKDCMASEVESDNDAALQIIKRSTFSNIKPTSDVTIKDAFST